MTDTAAAPPRPYSPIVTLTCLIALLHFGQPVLQPLTLAVMLSLALAPLIRRFTRVGLSKLNAVLLTLALVVTALAGAVAMLAGQLLGLSDDLPKYHVEIRAKMAQVRALTERPLAGLPLDLFDLVPPAPAGSAAPAAERLQGAGVQPVPVEIHERSSTTDAIAKSLGAVSGPLGETGLVLVLLIFILLSHDNLLDRIIRLTGQRDISRTMKGLEDAAFGVARFFASQVSVNLSFGLCIMLLLWLLGIPHAPLWGALCAVLRFVPYIGAVIAGGTIALFTAAVGPGWSLPLLVLASFGMLELVLANVIEPKVYGHSSGISPLGVIVSALFWSVLWGPVGLLLSTPLTLCLVVAGRYVDALRPLTILFAEGPNASAAQRLYQRALSGDVPAIIRDAHAFLRKSTLARYCDQTLLPGLALALTDVKRGLTDAEQEERLRTSIALAADTLATGARPMFFAPRRVSLLNANIGAHLRHAREQRLGRWQGSLDVPAHSVVLCAAEPNLRSEFLTELLVMALREAGVDARSVVLGSEDLEDHPDARHLLSTVFVTYPMQDELEDWTAHVAALRAELPEATLVALRPHETMLAELAPQVTQADLVLHSFEEALAFVLR